MQSMEKITILVYRPDDGPKNGLKLFTFVTNHVVHDGTPLDTFTDLSTTGMCHLKITNYKCLDIP
jgi:hypothetical protein